MWKKYITGIGVSLVLLIVLFQISLLRTQEQQTETERTDSVEADQTAELVTRTTCIVIESYDQNGNLITRTTQQPNAAMIGNNRLDMLLYANQYREQMSEQEQEDGLERMVLTSFSPEQVVLAKYYGEAEEPETYVLAVKDNAVIVYTGDRSQVYEYTNIELWTLPIEIQVELVEGIEVESEKELFDFLQTYSS